MRVNSARQGSWIGSLSTMRPERRGEIVAPGLKLIVVGTLATCQTAATVGVAPSTQRGTRNA